MESRQRAGHPTRTAVTGPLAPYADGFREDLAGKGSDSAFFDPISRTALKRQGLVRVQVAVTVPMADPLGGRGE